VAAKTYNPGIKQYYDRLIAKGKHKGVALNNVKNKLVHIITALAVNKTKYVEGYESFRKAS
jgi:transposase